MPWVPSIWNKRLNCKSISVLFSPLCGWRLFPVKERDTVLMFLYLLIWSPNNETLMNNKSGSFRVTLRGDSVGRDRRSGKGYLCKFTWGFTSITNYKTHNNHDWLDWKDAQSIVDWINSLNYTSWTTLLAFYQRDGKESKDGHHHTRQLQRKSFTSNRMEGWLFQGTLP